MGSGGRALDRTRESSRSRSRLPPANMPGQGRVRMTAAWNVRRPRFPPRAALSLAASLARPDHVQLLICNHEPLFFSTRDGGWFPTLRTLHKYPDMMPRLRADQGAIKFVLSGANIMCPGLTSPGATIHDEVRLRGVGAEDGRGEAPSPAAARARATGWRRPIRSACPVSPTQVDAGTPVALYAEGKEHAMAIGFTTLSTAEVGCRAPCLGRPG